MNVNQTSNSSDFQTLTPEENNLRRRLEAMDADERENAILSRLVILKQVAETITDQNSVGEPNIPQIIENRDKSKEREIQFPAKAKSFVANLVIGLQELFFNQYSAYKIICELHATGGDIFKTMENLVKGDLKFNVNLLSSDKLQLPQEVLEKYFDIVKAA